MKFIILLILIVAFITSTQALKNKNLIRLQEQLATDAKFRQEIDAMIEATGACDKCSAETCTNEAMAHSCQTMCDKCNDVFTDS